MLALLPNGSSDEHTSERGRGKEKNSERCRVYNVHMLQFSVTYSLDISSKLYVCAAYAFAIFQ